jgi:hypothetical protein
MRGGRPDGDDATRAHAVPSLGLDVHRDTIAVALAEETGQAASHSTIANEPGAVRKLIQRLGGPEVRPIEQLDGRPSGWQDEDVPRGRRERRFD